MKDFVRMMALVLSAVMILSGCGAPKLNSESNERIDLTAKEYVESITLSGKIKGVKENGMSIFKGIPYAQAPVGELRFAPPMEIEPWEGVLDCENFRAQCPQNQPTELQTVSEDCLNLNIWTPADMEQNEKLPIYVYIHGGAGAIGSAANPLYSGEGFAQKGIVYVSIQYRVNVLGWFASNETLKQYGTTGNWGILDQIEALKWIKKNASLFGGDPNNITIGGESFGAFTASALILSPLAEGLFQRVIMESGTILGNGGCDQYAKSDLNRAIELSNNLAYTFGAKDDAEGLKKMRAADADVLSHLSGMDADFTHTPAFFMFPVYDGKVMPKDPVQALGNGDFNKVDILYGYNKDEGSLFASDISEPEYKTIVYRIMGGSKAKEYLKRFPVNEQNSATERARQAIEYAIFTVGMNIYGDAFSDAGQNVYAYSFEFANAALKEKGLGARHASEMQYVFNATSIVRDMPADELTLKDEMHNRWVNFIKTGDPNNGLETPSNIIWQKYDSEDKNMLIFDTTVKCAVMPEKEDMDFMKELLFGDVKFYSDYRNPTISLD